MKLLSVTGMLGSGFRAESIDLAMTMGVDLVGCDAGTCDGGPSYLASGTAAFSAAAVGRDLELMLTRAVPAGVPVVIGSAGMSGCDAGVDWVSSLVRDIAQRCGLRFRLAEIRSEISADCVVEHLRAGRCAPLAPAVQLTEADARSSTRIVAVMGAEPIQQALAQGAQVVVAGRCTDAAIFAALPLQAGHDLAAAWHLAKILECGAAAVEQRAAPDCMLGMLDGDGFIVEPLRPDYRCTPQSVASHALYETADPNVLVEPSGTLMLAGARYEALSDRAVRVRGSRFEAAVRYTNKIEGVRLAGYSTVVFGGVRDPFILAELDSWLAGIEKQVMERVAHTASGTHFEIVTRVYGRDGVMAEREPTPRVDGHEVGILWDVIAQTQATAESIAKSLTHLALHFPISRWSGLITGVALPFSPAHINRGPVYEFHMNHVLAPSDPCTLFRTGMHDVH
jgi:hypothetical protein